jgi:hypothetical protein
MSFITNGRLYIELGGKALLNSRLAMEEHLGRELTKGEHVHHIDGDTLNDSTENLEIVSRSEHMSIHKPHSKPHTSEAIEKMSQSHMGNQGALGHKLSEEVKKQIGRKTSQKGREYWSNLTLEQYAQRIKNMGRKV